MILALETATPVCSVAFENSDGKQFEERINSPGSHSEKLFIFINKLMDAHHFRIDDLSAVLVSEGPGSYTGLRIAASGVKGLLFNSKIPLYSVPTPASFAVSALRHKATSTKIHAIIDARRVHLYHQEFSFSGGEMKADSKVEITPIQTFEKRIEPGDVIVGTGLDRIGETILESVCCLGMDYISARSLIQLYHREESRNFIQKVNPANFDPNYFTSWQE